MVGCVVPLLKQKPKGFVVEKFGVFVNSENETTVTTTRQEKERTEMKKCAEYGVSENGNKRCKRFVTVSEANKNDDVIMAKATDGKNLGYFNIAEVQDAIGSLGGIVVADILPPLVGGAGAIVGTLLIRKFVKNKSSNLIRFAPALGAGVGVLASIPLYWVYGPRGVISGALTAAVAGGAILGYQELKNLPAFNGLGLLNVQQKRLGAVVASGGGAYAVPSARVPGRVGSAMDVAAFGGKTTY